MSAAEKQAHPALVTDVDDAGGLEPRALAVPNQKDRQAEYFDQLGETEFEINRPHLEPRLYRFIMEYKLRRVLELMSESLEDRSVLAVCCGSGMDAEFLARQGARVTALDISPGALRGARERSIRYAVDYDLVQGDAENMPFEDQAFDYSFVHDGLHHLPRPMAALREMARVARRGLLITEPADASLTRLAIRLRLIPAYEEAGNFVLRFSPEQLREECARLGFERFAAERYLVKYGHPPGRSWHIFDSDPLFNVARAAFNLFGVRMLGRVGNKITAVALREGI